MLESLSQTFTIFEPSDTFKRDMLIIFGIGAVFKLGFTLLFIRKTGSGRQPERAASAKN